MNLNDTLTLIAADWGFDAAELIAYADEDNIGGFDFNANQSAWPGGSLWDVEGRTLFALVRAWRPRRILELGVHAGASTTHLRTAVSVNGVGHVVSVDKWSGAGHGIPPELTDYGTLIFADALATIDTLKDGSIDMAFEDCIHSYVEVKAIYEALKPKMKKGGLLLSHDAMHPNEGEHVRRAIKDAGYEAIGYLTEPSDCGLSIARME